jgi:GTP-binding protein EngB required for normal cell division
MAAESHVDLDSDIVNNINDVSDNQYNLLSSIACKIKQFGKNKLNAEASVILNDKTQFLIIGPARVGKSTLISTVTGNDNIEISGSLDSCTKKIQYYDMGKIRFWDTPGFEGWQNDDVDSMWKNIFSKNNLLPVFCIFCVSKGAFANTSTIKYMFDNYLHKYSIPVCWTITNAGSCDINSTECLMNDAKKDIREAKENVKKRYCLEIRKRIFSKN